jgi:hypothetical protein
MPARYVLILGEDRQAQHRYDAERQHCTA